MDPTVWRRVLSALSPTHPGLSHVLSHADPVALLVAHEHAVGARSEGMGLSACNANGLPLPSCRVARGEGTLASHVWAGLGRDGDKRRRAA